MKRKEITAALAAYGYKVIRASWYRDGASIICYAYDDHGVPHFIYINTDHRVAKRQMLSTIQIMKQTDISYMIFKEVDPCVTY